MKKGIIHLDIKQIPQPERRQSNLLYYMVTFFYKGVELSTQELNSFNMKPISNIGDAFDLVKYRLESDNSRDKVMIITAEHADGNMTYDFKGLVK